MAGETLRIVSMFTSSGTPTTGLSPTIRIRDLADNSLVVTDGAMTEVGDGVYQFNFTSVLGYILTTNFSIRTDGTATLPTSERFHSAVTNTMLDIISAYKINRYAIDDANDKQQIYGIDGITVLFENTLTDKDGSTITLQGTSPSNRGSKTDI